MQTTDRAELTAPLGFVLGDDRPSGLRMSDTALDDAPDTRRTPSQHDVSPDTPRAPPLSGRLKMLATAPHHRPPAPMGKVKPPAREEPSPQSTTRPSMGVIALPASLPTSLATSHPVTSSMMVVSGPPTNQMTAPPPMSEAQSWGAHVVSLASDSSEVVVVTGSCPSLKQLAAAAVVPSVPSAPSLPSASAHPAFQPTVAVPVFPSPSPSAHGYHAIPTPFAFVATGELVAPALGAFTTTPPPPSALAPFGSLDAFQSTFLATPAQRLHVVLTTVMIGVMAIMLVVLGVERRRAPAAEAAQATATAGQPTVAVPVPMPAVTTTAASGAASPPAPPPAMDLPPPKAPSAPATAAPTSTPTPLAVAAPPVRTPRNTNARGGSSGSGASGGAAAPRPAPTTVSSSRR